MIVWTIWDIVSVGVVALGGIAFIVLIAGAYAHDIITKSFCKHTHRDSVIHNVEHCRRCGKRFAKK